MFASRAPKNRAAVMAHEKVMLDEVFPASVQHILKV
jgi:hypothetical protein